MHKNIVIIPIKVSTYDDLFNKIHNAELNKRKLDEDINELIKTIYFQIDNLKHRDLLLEITLPKSTKSSTKENLVREGIINNYKAFSVHEKRVKSLGLFRLCYYVAISLILLSAWFFVKKKFGESIITALLNAGGTVVLWQAMTLVLINHRDLKIISTLHKKLSQMKITFIYE